jgi:hypothetical protein
MDSSAANLNGSYFEALLGPLFSLGGAFTTGQAAQRAPQKTTGLPLAGPDQARSLRLSPSRSTACLRDPRRHRTQHPSWYLRQAPRRRQTHWRVISNWPPSPCPLHGATRPLFVPFFRPHGGFPPHHSQRAETPGTRDLGQRHPYITSKRDGLSHGCLYHMVTVPYGKNR